VSERERKTASYAIDSGRVTSPGVVPPEQILTAADFPVLSSLLQSEPRSPVVREVLRLLARAFRPRAPRVTTKRPVTVRFEGYEETGLVKDVSMSGARILVPGSVSLDVSKASTMQIVIAQGHEAEQVVPLCLVRVAGIDPPHIEIGCRFLVPDDAKQAVVDLLGGPSAKPR